MPNVTAAGGGGNRDGQERCQQKPRDEWRESHDPLAAIPRVPAVGPGSRRDGRPRQGWLVRSNGEKRASWRLFSGRCVEAAHAAKQSPFPRAEAFSVHELIDPRETRPMLCRWIERIQPLLPPLLGPSAFSVRP